MGEITALDLSNQDDLRKQKLGMSSTPAGILFVKLLHRMTSHRNAK
jgi:hypothetical protein